MYDAVGHKNVFKGEKNIYNKRNMDKPEIQ
jgi:hypothetical protein